MVNATKIVANLQNTFPGQWQAQADCYQLGTPFIGEDGRSANFMVVAIYPGNNASADLIYDDNGNAMPGGMTCALASDANGNILDWTVLFVLDNNVSQNQLITAMGYTPA